MTNGITERHTLVRSRMLYGCVRLSAVSVLRWAGAREGGNRLMLTNETPRFNFQGGSGDESTILLNQRQGFILASPTETSDRYWQVVLSFFDFFSILVPFLLPPPPNLPKRRAPLRSTRVVLNVLMPDVFSYDRSTPLCSLGEMWNDKVAPVATQIFYTRCQFLLA